MTIKPTPGRKKQILQHDNIEYRT